MSTLLGAAAVQRLPRPQRFGSPAPISSGRAAKVRALRVNSSAVSSAWATLLGEYERARVPAGPIDPFQIPNVYTDPAGNAEAVVKIRYDGIAALNLALRYALDRDEADAAAAAAQIAPWAGVQSFIIQPATDTRLAWSYTFPFFLAAAMLIRGSLAWTPTLDAAMADVTTRSLPLCSTAWTNPGNQGSWGVVFEMAAASFLGDTSRFRAACGRWRTLFDTHIEGNVPIDEVYRQGSTQGNGASGLYYSRFALAAMTYGAEWARFNGEWLYDHRAPDGSTLRGVFENVAGWDHHPETFTYNTSGTTTTVTEIQGHYEILHALWPNPDAAWLLANKPIIDRYGLRYLTLTHHGQPLRG